MQFQTLDSMARKQKIRSLKKRRPVLIGAGITEQAYFKHLVHLKNYQIEVVPRFCGNDTPYYLEKYVKMVLEDGGLAVCIYDMDESERHEKIKKKLTEFVSGFANNPSVLLCGSMPSIEYWFLLHYEKTNRYFGTSKKVIKALNKHMEFEKTEKFLSKSTWVEMLLANGRMQKAMQNADELGNNGESYTYVPDAIRFLEKHMKK